MMYSKENIIITYFMFTYIIKHDLYLPGRATSELMECYSFLFKYHHVHLVVYTMLLVLDVSLTLLVDLNYWY